MHRTDQHLVAVIGRPHQVITVVEYAMFAGVILHDLILGKMSHAPPAAHFSEDKIITRFFALKRARLEDGVYDPKRGY